MTTTTTPDVNLAFHNDRVDMVRDIAARVAAGTLKPLGGGWYESTDGPDKGEKMTMRGPIHGLDLLEEGRAALYTATPTWHALEGKVFDGGVSDIDTVLHAAGLDYEVGILPVFFTPEKTPGNRRPKALQVPGRRVTYRKDTGDPFDIVGGRYVPWQNRDAFAFLQNLVGTDEVIWESAGRTRNGRRAFISMRIPVDIVIGGVDTVRCYIVVVNSHDGTTPFRVLITPWRPVCRNTERFALRDAAYSIALRHTATAQERFVEARRVLGISSEFFKRWEAEELALLRVDTTIDAANALIDEMFPTKDDASDKTKAIADGRRQQILGLFELEGERIGRNNLALERAFTGWADHLQPKTPRALKGQPDAVVRATAVVEDEDGKLKSRVHERLMLRVR